MRVLPFGVIDTIAPARLGRSFRWLLASSIVTNIGDGIALAAGPLLVASLTRDPLLVSMALLVNSSRTSYSASRLAPSPIAMTVGGSSRASTSREPLVLAVLAATIVTGTVDIAIVLLALFVLGTAEIFADVASHSLPPQVVKREDLGIANARLMSSFLLTNQLLAPPIGAFLFGLGMALPFATNAACFALGALLVTRVVTDVADTVAERTGEGRDCAPRCPRASAGSWRTRRCGRSP